MSNELGGLTNEKIDRWRKRSSPLSRANLIYSRVPASNESDNIVFSIRGKILAREEDDDTAKFNP